MNTLDTETNSSHPSLQNVSFAAGGIEFVFFLFIATLITLQFGISVEAWIPNKNLLESGLVMIVSAGLGWVMMFILSALHLESFFQYWYALSRIMFVGAIPLLPHVAYFFFYGTHMTGLAAAGLLVGMSLMIYLHFSQSRRIGVPDGYTFIWFICLQAGFWFSMFMF